MSFYDFKGSSGGKEAPYYDSDGNEYWEVERIVNRKIDPVDGILKYEVKWLGYPEEENTWEPLESLEHVRKMVDDFEKARVAMKNLPNKTPQSAREQSKKKDLQQPKSLGENVLEEKQDKKPTLTPKMTENKKSFGGNERGSKIDVDQNDEQRKMLQRNDPLPNMNTKSLESKSIPQPPGIISSEKQMIKNIDSTAAKDINLNSQERLQGLGDKVVAVVSHNEQRKASSGLPQPPNQSRYSPNYSNLNNPDKIVQSEGKRGSEFDIVSKTTGISGNNNSRVINQKADEDRKALLKNSSVLGELFHPKKPLFRELDVMIIEDDDSNEEVKASTNAGENIKRENSEPGVEGPMMTRKSPLSAKSQPVKKKSRFQDASEVLGKEAEKLLEVPKAITRRESEKPTEKEKDINIEGHHLRRAVSSNAGIPSNGNQMFERESIEELKSSLNIAGEIQLGEYIEECEIPLNAEIPSHRSSKFQETEEERRRGSDKSREKEEDRERERDQSEDRRSARRLKKKFYSESRPPQESNQSAYYETIKESYLKHEMNKNEFLEFLCPYGNFKDDKMGRISKVFWEGKASANPDDYYFEIIWRVRGSGVHKAPSVVSWEDLLDGNPREAAKFSFGRLTKIFSNFGTLEEEESLR